MTTHSHTVTCTAISRIARDVYEFRFSKPEGFAFIPGQFVLFDVPLIDHPRDIQTRSFSLASSPTEDELIFVAKMKEGGRASRWIRESLTPGTEARMQGPTGRFTLDRETDKDYLMIATSTGVGPFRGQLKTILPEDDNRHIDLVFGVRAEEDLFWAEELQGLAKQYENFFLHLALSQPSHNWKEHRGRVQTLVPQIMRDFSGKKVYACGNPDMTKEIKELALNDWNVSKEDFHMEGYI